MSWYLRAWCAIIAFQMGVGIALFTPWWIGLPAMLVLSYTFIAPFLQEMRHLDTAFKEVLGEGWEKRKE